MAAWACLAMVAERVLPAMALLQAWPVGSELQGAVALLVGLQATQPDAEARAPLQRRRLLLVGCRA